jgi:hypothetical protein
MAMIVTCPDCGTPRESYLRYCRKCGQGSEGVPAPPGTRVAPPMVAPAASLVHEGAVAYVREEGSLVGSWILRGFGLGIGLFLAGLLLLLPFWIVVGALVTADLHS